MKNYKETIILLAEDDDGHAELTTQGLRNSGICNEIIRFANGEELWFFYQGKEIKYSIKISPIYYYSTFACR